jgi:hypothetical protein
LARCLLLVGRIGHIETIGYRNPHATHPHKEFLYLSIARLFGSNGTFRRLSPAVAAIVRHRRLRMMTKVVTPHPYWKTRGRRSGSSCGQHRVPRGTGQLAPELSCYRTNEAISAGDKKKETVMLTMTRTIAALGFIGAAAVGVSSPSAAQGVYFQGPGIEVGVGNPWYGPRYRHYDYSGPSYYSGPTYYSYDRPYRSERRYYRSHRWNWD